MIGLEVGVNVAFPWLRPLCPPSGCSRQPVTAQKVPLQTFAEPPPQMGGLKTKGAIFQQDWELKGECQKEELNEGFFSFKLAWGQGGGIVQLDRL